jgi:hypothetical protein
LGVAGVQGVHAQLDRQVLYVALSYPVDELMNQKNRNEIFLVEEFTSRRSERPSGCDQVQSEIRRRRNCRSIAAPPFRHQIISSHHL